MEICFVLVEDRSVTVEDVKLLLRTAGVEELQIYPSNGRVVKTWEDAFRLVTLAKAAGFDPAQKCTVLLTDLVLTEKGGNPAGGVEELLSHAWTDQYVRIAVTRFPSATAGQLDGDYDANRLGDRSSSLMERAQHLMRVVKSAVGKWSTRTGRSAPQFPIRPWTIEDSVGARQAQAALDDALPALVEIYITRWANIRVKCLSGGYSGAFVLHLTGHEEGVVSQIVCKISRRKSLLDEEVAKVAKVAERYQAFQGMIPLTPGEVQQLACSPPAWYIRYAAASGETLEKVMLKAIADGETVLKPGISIVFSRLRQAAEAVADMGLREGNTEKLLLLSGEDVDRFDMSLSQLTAFRGHCVSRGYLANELWHSGSSLAAFRDAVVKGWASAISQAGLSAVPACDQHGDLNARNIMVSERSIQLIDWARWGCWPVGYDVARLELQLLLRLTEAADMADQFPNWLADWMVLWTEVRNGMSAPAPAADPRYRLCVEACKNLSEIRSALFTPLRTDSSAAGCNQVTALVRAYDAIKMASYADASWPKRLWFLLIAVQSAQDAGIRW